MTAADTVNFLSEALLDLRILTDLTTITALDADLNKTTNDFAPLRDRLRGIRRAFEALDALAYDTPPARGSLLYDGINYRLTVIRMTPKGQAITLTAKGRFLEGATRVQVGEDDRFAHPTVSGRSSGAGSHTPGSNVPW